MANVSIATRVSVGLFFITLFPFACGSPAITPQITSVPGTPGLAPTATIQQPATATATPSPSPSPLPSPTQVLSAPNFALCWVAYSPTKYNPDVERFPLPSAIREDLAVLRATGFEGVITYGATGTLTQIPERAKDAGFRQIIMGIWDPADQEEMNAAIAESQFVDGYIIGNEGLNERYELTELQEAMLRVRNETGKPVATTEQIEDYYSEPGLSELGDWVAPVVHPYWNGFKNGIDAAEWTYEEYNELEKELGAERIIQFKEVGMPSAGEAELTEENQALYYQELQALDVRFAYFEAFDQDWKTHSPVEPYWGLFDKDRNPKQVAGLVCGKTPPTPTPTPTLEPTRIAAPVPTATIPIVPTKLPPPSSPTVRIIEIFDNALAPGYKLNIDNNGHIYGWLKVTDGALRVDFLEKEPWAAVFITNGDPSNDPSQRKFEDLSNCLAMNVDLWSPQAGTIVKVGMKDVQDGPGEETLVPQTLTPSRKTYKIPLSQFTTADLTQIHLPFELVYHDPSAVTVFADRIQFECRP